MSDFIIVLVLAIGAAFLAGIELFRTRAQDLIAWAVLALALAVIVERL